MIFVARNADGNWKKRLKARCAGGTVFFQGRLIRAKTNFAVDL